MGNDIVTEQTRKKLKELYADLKHYEWLCENIDTYVFEDENTISSDSIIMYQGKENTFYIEIKKKYDEFVRLYDFDIFGYISGYEKEKSSKIKLIHPKVTSSCLIKIDEYIVPVGFLCENELYFEIILENQDCLYESIYCYRDIILQSIYKRGGSIDNKLSELKKLHMQLESKTDILFDFRHFYLIALILSMALLVFYQSSFPWKWFVLLIFLTVELFVLNYIFVEFRFAQKLIQLDHVIYELRDYKKFIKSLKNRISTTIYSFKTRESFRIEVMATDDYYRYYEEILGTSYEFKKCKNKYYQYVFDLTMNKRVIIGKISIVLLVMLILVVLIWGTIRVN